MNWATNQQHFYAQPPVNQPAVTEIEVAPGPTRPKQRKVVGR